MPPRCQEEAETVLGAHFLALADLVTDAVRFYFEFYGERAYLHEPWTRCSIIRDEIKERLTLFCAETPGFHPVFDGNATYFGAHSKFLIRPKKLFDNLHANTGKTQLSFDYDHQFPVPVQLDLFAEETPTNIYLGYVPTENDPLNPPIYLVCNDDTGDIAWSIHLNGSAPSPGATLEPTTPTAPAPDSEPRRVRVKDAAQKKIGNE